MKRVIASIKNHLMVGRERIVRSNIHLYNGKGGRAFHLQEQFSAVLLLVSGNEDEYLKKWWASEWGKDGNLLSWPSGLRMPVAVGLLKRDVPIISLEGAIIWASLDVEIRISCSHEFYESETFVTAFRYRITVLPIGFSSLISFSLAILFAVSQHSNRSNRNFDEKCCNLQEFVYG